jgi:hypothetical protein
MPEGARFSAPVQTGPEIHPASYTMGTGSFPGVRRQRRGVERTPHLAPRLKKGYRYTSTSHLRLHGLFKGELYLPIYTYTHKHTHTHIYIYLCICASMYVYMYVRMWVCVCMYVCIYVCTYVCMCVYMHLLVPIVTRK